MREPRVCGDCRRLALCGTSDGHPSLITLRYVKHGPGPDDGFWRYQCGECGTQWTLHYRRDGDERTWWAVAPGSVISPPPL